MRADLDRFRRELRTRLPGHLSDALRHGTGLGANQSHWVAYGCRPGTVVGVLREMKAAGKAVVGMKILGQGDLRNRQDEAIKYALSLGVLDAFTIGAENKMEQEDLIRRIAAA